MQSKKGIIFAHRGFFGKNAPENSLSAFKQAIDAGLGIELDIRLSRDGIPVVFHDSSLKRMCGDPRRVSELTFTELKKLRLDGTDEGIPSLAETLELIGGRTVLLIETKVPKHHIWHHRLERRTASVLAKYKGEFLLQSFNKYSMRYMKRRFPDIDCGILSGEIYPEPRGFDFISYRLSGLTAEKTARLRKKYPRVFGWSVSGFHTADCEKAFGELDLDGVIM